MSQFELTLEKFLFELTLEKFLFPINLPNNKANFRFVADLRFTNDQGEFTTEHAVMPSLDTFWECDKSRADKPNYVRGDDQNPAPADAIAKFSQFNMAAIDDWDRLILHVKGQSVHSIQFKVIDVDRKDAWDKVKNFLGGIVETVIGKVKSVIPQDFPLFPPGSLGGAADDMQSFLLKKLAGGMTYFLEDRPNWNSETENHRNSRSEVREQKGSIRSVLM